MPATSYYLRMRKTTNCPNDAILDHQDTMEPKIFQSILNYISFFKNLLAKLNKVRGYEAIGMIAIVRTKWV